jgi:nucleotide-binding universal stress UspA family protein
MKTNKIIAAVDLGPDTERITAYAFWLAMVTGAGEVSLIHVVDYGLTPPSYVMPYLEKEKGRLEAEINKWTERLRNSGLKAEGKIEVGRLVETFHGVIDSLGADALILGYKHHLVRASSSERLIKSLPIPLLIVRGKKAGDVTFGAVEMKTVLCAVDFSGHSIKALELAKKISGAGGAGLVVVHAVKPLHTGLEVGEGIRERYCKEHLEDAELKMAPLIAEDTGIRSVIREGAPCEVIARVAEETDASMLFMGARGLSYLKGVLMGSVSDALIKSSPCPVMIVR